MPAYSLIPTKIKGRGRYAAYVHQGGEIWEAVLEFWLLESAFCLNQLFH